MAQEHLQWRNGGYYFRHKIPADLLVHYGKYEIVRSLLSVPKVATGRL